MSQQDVVASVIWWRIGVRFALIGGGYYTARPDWQWLWWALFLVQTGFTVLFLVMVFAAWAYKQGAQGK